MAVYDVSVPGGGNGLPCVVHCHVWRNAPGARQGRLRLRVRQGAARGVVHCHVEGPCRRTCTSRLRVCPGIGLSRRVGAL